MPTSNQSPRVNQGCRLSGAHGAPHLPFGFAAKPSPSVPWARGLLPAFWEWESPNLSACGQRRGSRGGPVRPIVINSSSIPSRGAKPCGVDDAGLPQGQPRELLVTQAMMIETRRAPASAMSSFPLWCKGGKRRRRVPRHQAKVTISVQRDQDQQSGRMEVTMVPKTASSPVPLAAKNQLS